MLLRVLATQLGGSRCIYLPYPALGIEELAQFALDAMGSTPIRRALPAALSQR